MLKLIDTLRTVTAGKIYVENERARLTHRLALIHEKDDNVTEAAKIMQELQVRLIKLKWVVTSFHSQHMVFAINL